MSSEHKDFYGKDVAEAIKNACDEFGVAQENLTIEVLETGSKGIFGLIRQKAHIRASIQKMEEELSEQPPEKMARKSKAKPRKKPVKPEVIEEKPEEPAKEEVQDLPEVDSSADFTTDDDNGDDDEDDAGEPGQMSADSLSAVKDELTKMLELMGCPSSVEVDDEDGIAHCRVSDEHQEVLISQEGRVLDSLQYLLRKIVSKKIGGRIQLTIDVGNYREKRYEELRALALEYGSLVKEDGKTQVIPSLNPSERRIVHVALQDDPEIRSRSVGEGLFKKVLIYKPGKGRRNNNRKRGRARYRKKSEPRSRQET